MQFKEAFAIFITFALFTPQAYGQHTHSHNGPKGECYVPNDDGGYDTRPLLNTIEIVDGIPHLDRYISGKDFCCEDLGGIGYTNPQGQEICCDGTTNC